MSEVKKTKALKPVTEYIKGSKKGTIIIVIGIIGIILIMLSEVLPNSSKNNTSSQDDIHKNITSEQYIKQTEEKISAIVSMIDGAGKTKVLITLESGYEYVFAREEKINTDKTQDTYDDVHQKLQTKDSSETKYILIEDGDSEKALITTEIEPKIKGVVIICEGGDKTLVKQRITDAITTAFGISTTRVCVTKINSN